MKVLHVVPSFGLGGMERIICSLINRTSYCYRHEVLVLYDKTSAREWLERSDVQITCMYRSLHQLKYLFNLYHIFQEKKPFILMSYNWGSTDAIWIARLLGLNKIIHSEHGFNIDESVSTSFKRNIMRFLVYRLSSRLIVVSHELKLLMKTQYFLNEDRVTLIENGIDTERYTPNSSERVRIRKSLGIQNDDLVIGFSGRLDPIKNFELMLEIFSEYKYSDKKFKFMIVGDGPEKEFIQKKCLEKHLEDHLLLLGEKKDVVPYLRAMDVFLLTSFREQMPMTILEAMAVALPVISTNVGEVSRIISDGQEGFVLDGKSAPSVFATTLLELRDQESRRKMGEASRRKVINAFREEQMIQQYKNLIASLV
jgi:glycosyltransferase involved in cell wall biosynthesis